MANYGDGSDVLSTYANALTIDIFSIGADDSINFKAFVESFSDKYTSEWNSESVFGKMDNIATFKRTARVISLAFAVPSYDITEAEVNLFKANKLIKYLYPNYNVLGDTATMASSPLIKIKFGNLICDAKSNPAETSAKRAGLVGYLDGYTFEPNLDLGVFIDTKKEQTNGRLIPKSFKVSFNFTVIHTHPLGINSNNRSFRQQNFAYKESNSLQQQTKDVYNRKIQALKSLDSD